MRIAVGQGSCGIAAGAGGVYSRLKELCDDVHTTGCIGMCFAEPIVDIYDGKALKKRLVKDKADDTERIANAVNSGNLESLNVLRYLPRMKPFSTDRPALRCATRHNRSHKHRRIHCRRRI